MAPRTPALATLRISEINRPTTPKAICQPLYFSVHETGFKPREAYKYQDWESAFYEKVARGEIDISPRYPDSFVKS